MALFEDIFNIRKIDPDGKKFEKVSRIICDSENYEMQLHLDVNTDVYPLDLERNNKFTMLLASTLNLDGSADSGEFDQSGRPSLADKFDYVMYGKVFKYVDEKGSASKLALYASFGGLLMMLKGDARTLQTLSLDQRIYLLMRVSPS
eukprot:TRINITY_DN27431_c0_g1_i1.p1 TRINITY_DN27431_c0_g1~~TRINITY_DN27431_c0_g1_i1.p1  ORF type:complete len:147 (+),score=34.60 TRINITY_DN27431_c0_g1_i1:78-518(+)